MPIFRAPAFALARSFPPHTAQVSPTSRTVTSTGYSSATATTAAVTASATGGSGLFSYSWSCTNGWSATSPNSATTTFTSPAIGGGQTSTGTATVTITDLQTGATSQANVSLAHERQVEALGWSISPTWQLVSGSYPFGPLELSGSWTVTFTGGSGDYSLSVERTSGDVPDVDSSGGNTVSLTYNVPWPETRGSWWLFHCVDNLTGQSLSVERVFTFRNDPNG